MSQRWSVSENGTRPAAPPQAMRNTSAPRGQPLPFWGSSVQPERLAAVLKHAPAGARILDLGTGRGAYVDELSRSGFSVVGCDIHLYPEWLGRSSRRFVVGHAAALPFRPASFDATIAFEVLEHCPEPRKVLEAIARCTTGHVILSVPDCNLDNALRRHDLAMAHWTDPSHCSFFTRASLLELVEGCGLRVVDLSPCCRISPNAYFWDTIRLPRLLRRAAEKTCEKLHLVETYWSSILVVARTEGSSAP